MKRFLCIVVPLLAWCAPALQAKEEKRVIPITRLAPGQGMVMMRLISNSELSQGAPKWDKFDVRHLKTGQVYKIHDLYEYGHHATFVMSLPPGEYQADRLRVGDPIWQSLGVYGEANFEGNGAWRFKIEAGRMTNLGSVLLLQPYTPLSSRDPRLVATRQTRLAFRWIHIPDDTLPQRSSFLFHPDDYPAVLSKSLGWTSIGADASPNSLTPQLKKLSLSLSGATPTVAGGTLFGEHFGQVAWRHADGKWSWEDTGTIESILVVADTPNGTRYAAAEGSILLRRHAPGDWRRIPVDLEDATPRMLYAFGDGSLLTIWEQFNKCTALRFRPDGEPKWTQEWEIPAPKSKVRRNLGYYNAMLSPRGLVFSTEIFGFGLSTDTLAVWDFIAEKWEISDRGFKGSIAMLPDGALYSMTGGMSNQSFKVSKDLGATWETRSVGSNLLKKPQFRTPDDGLTIGVNPDGSGILLRTLDGGRSWPTIANLPRWAHWFLVLPGQEILVATEFGQLYSSRDLGESWRQERDSATLQ